MAWAAPPGDLEPDSPGNEVVVVNAAGEVWMVHRDGDGWKPRRIYEGTGELIMCAIGDLDPRHAGNEFVGVGMVRGEESLHGPGQVLMLHRQGRVWAATQAGFAELQSRMSMIASSDPNSMRAAIHAILLSTCRTPTASGTRGLSTLPNARCTIWSPARLMSRISERSW